MTQILIILGVVVLSFALRSFRIRFLGKIGALGLLVATFLAFYFFTGSLIAGFGGVLLWFLLPWIELLTRVRTMRLPVSKELERQAPPGNARFPAFSEMTYEIEQENFEYISDNGWEWDGMNQFYRLFYNEEYREQAAICLTEQDEVSWACFSLSTQSPDGRIFRTTNLPFSNPMKSAPDLDLRQEPEVESFDELLFIHREWMLGMAMEPEDLVAQDPDSFATAIEKETDAQIRYNLEEGLIRYGETGDTIRYSWKGLFYLYFQLVKDMITLC